MDRRTERDPEAGFSMVELMIVVLIIGILVAVALPTYLGARTRSADRAMQSELRAGLGAALTYYSQAQNWTGFDAATARNEEASLTWVDGGPPARGEIAIVIHVGQDLLMVGLSSSGTYLCLAQIATSPATDRGKGAAFADVDTVAECDQGW